MEEKVKQVLDFLNSIEPEKYSYYKCIKCGSKMSDPSVNPNKSTTMLICNNNNCKHHSSTLDDDSKRIKIIGQNEILRKCLMSF